MLLPRGKRREKLERWFAAGVERLSCLPWEKQNGLQWAQLPAKLRTSGQAMPIKDSLIAATVLVHGLIVATRNREDFQKSGIRVINPFV